MAEEELFNPEKLSNEPGVVLKWQDEQGRQCAFLWPANQSTPPEPIAGLMPPGSTLTVNDYSAAIHLPTEIETTGGETTSRIGFSLIDSKRITTVKTPSGNLSFSYQG